MLYSLYNISSSVASCNYTTKYIVGARRNSWWSEVAEAMSGHYRSYSRIQCGVLIFVTELNGQAKSILRFL